VERRSRPGSESDRQKTERADRHRDGDELGKSDKGDEAQGCAEVGFKGKSGIE
jgi:hypothetical protein